MDRISSGSDEMSEAGARLAREFDEAVTPKGSPARSLGRALPIMGTDPVSVLGPGSFHAQLLDALGAASLPREGEAYIRLDTEDVIRIDPDSIVLIMPGEEESNIEAALGPLADVDLRAVRENRVLLVNHPHALTPSTSLIEVARNIVEACEGMTPPGDSP
jgi:ABC-type Fe3+-hydroxamate transport system substrate-binding protein